MATAGKKSKVKRKTVTRRAGATQTRKKKSLRTSSASRDRKIQGATIEIPVNNKMAAKLQETAEAHGFKNWKTYAKRFGKGALERVSNVL